jgi:hypothetical protein
MQTESKSTSCGKSYVQANTPTVARSHSDWPVKSPATRLAYKLLVFKLIEDLLTLQSILPKSAQWSLKV